MERDDEQGDGAGDGGGGDEGAENVDGGRMDPADNVQEEVVVIVPVETWTTTMATTRTCLLREKALDPTSHLIRSREQTYLDTGMRRTCSRNSC